MILAQRLHLQTTIDRHEGATISDISHIAHFSHNEDDDCAGSGSFHKCLLSVWSMRQTHLVHEFVFGLLETTHECLLWIPWERIFSHNEMVQIVSQEFRAGMPTMSVIDTEEGAFRPVFMLSMFWFDYVQYDGDTVFVISANKTLVGIGRVSSNYAIPAQTTLSCFMIRNHNSSAWLKGKLASVFLFTLNACILMEHLVNVYSRK